MYFKALACCAGLYSVVNGLPSAALDGLVEERQSSNMPLLTLDYGTYQASIYNSDADIYTFRNIRYAAAPVGQLRWKKPQPPGLQTGIQNGSVGYSCVQPVTTAYPQSEDCLFLDLYVPGKAVRTPSAFSLPVAVWVHGGNDLQGSKDQRMPTQFNGTGPIITSNNSLIFVATNYRLGPFGFLAGDTMEKNGLPNAGLHDIRAAFQWVQKYISKVGGDKTKVSAWGESSGASNLLHQLVAQGGKLDPLFSKAVLQSPASLTLVDRKGMSENCFQTYASLANCSGADLTCLRSASTATLESASVQLTATGKICGGVQSDGTYIRQAAHLEFASHSYWPNLSSLIVTHTANESFIFVPPSHSTDASFTNYITVRFPTYAANDGIVDAILKYYNPPPSSTSGGYQDEYGRFAAWIRDNSITIRVAEVGLAYANNNVWVGEYGVPPAYHATDLIPLFWNKYANFTSIAGAAGLTYPVPPNINALSKTYQSYVVSHALTGNPNTYANTGASSYPAIFWPKPTIYQNQRVSNVLNFTSSAVVNVIDDQVLGDPLYFQLQLAAAVTNQGGYAVPGTVFNSGSQFPPTPANPSANYVNQCTECIET